MIVALLLFGVPPKPVNYGILARGCRGPASNEAVGAVGWAERSDNPRKRLYDQRVESGDVGLHGLLNRDDLLCERPAEAVIAAHPGGACRVEDIEAVGRKDLAALRIGRPVVEDRIGDFFE